MIRVLLADDHTLVRRGIAGLLQAQPDIEVVGEADNGLDAVSQARNLVPDVVLMDIGMPGLSGLDATRRIRDALPQTQVLILTVHDREDYLYNALQAGASGYILKGADVHDLVGAIRTVFRGDTFMYPKMATKLVADYLRRVRAGEGTEEFERLTEREKEILKLLAEGYTNKEIAGALQITPHTVQTHREHLFQKLNIHSRTELLKYALRKGLVSLDS